jgi:RNA polymerase sigma-70 factor (ECF subfamily)
MTPEPIPLRSPQARTGQPDAEALIRRVARGDEDAFGRLYDLLINSLFGIARRVIRDPDRAEEVTQEALVEIWQQAPRFDPDKASVRSWACMITHRRAVDAVRREETSRRTEQRAVHRSARREFDEVAETVVDNLDYAQVRKCLGTLTELQAEAVGMAYFQGLTYPEVAGLLDVNLATIKTRMRDGLIRLRDCLGVRV